MSENNNKNIIIGFDMDGVILNNTEPKIRVAQKLGYSIRPEQTPAEVIVKYIPPGTYPEFQNLIYDNPEEALTATLMKGIRSLLVEIKRRKFPYYLISRRKGPEMAIRILEKHKLWPRYFNDNNAFFVSTPADKNIKAAQLGVTHYIDDELKVINALSSVGNKFLFDQFNIFEEGSYYKKINSWAEFRKHLDLD